MNKIPECPHELPSDIADMIKELGCLWTASIACPKIKDEIKLAWDKLLQDWMNESALPLLIRKSSYIRGSEVIHKSGRKIVFSDNSPAQWSCNLALREIVPTLSQIQEDLKNDSIPISFALKKEEKEKRSYHCTLGKYTVNKAGWKLCHVISVGLNSPLPPDNMNIDEIKTAFFNLLSPSNYFLLPQEWGGLGETSQFIKGYLSNDVR